MRVLLLLLALVAAAAAGGPRYSGNFNFNSVCLNPIDVMVPGSPISKMHLAFNGADSSARRQFNECHFYDGSDPWLTLGFGHHAATGLPGFTQHLKSDSKAWAAVVAHFTSTMTASKWGKLRSEAKLTGDSTPNGAALMDKALTALLCAAPADEDQCYKGLLKPWQKAIGEDFNKYGNWFHDGWQKASLDPHVARAMVIYWNTHTVGEGENKCAARGVHTLGGIGACVSATSSGYGATGLPKSSSGTWSMSMPAACGLPAATYTWNEKHWGSDPDTVQDARALIAWQYYQAAKEKKWRKKPRCEKVEELRKQNRERMNRMWEVFFKDTWGPIPGHAQKRPSHLGKHMEKGKFTSDNPDDYVIPVAAMKRAGKDSDDYKCSPAVCAGFGGQSCVPRGECGDDRYQLEGLCPGSGVCCGSKNSKKKAEQKCSGTCASPRFCTKRASGSCPGNSDAICCDSSSLNPNPDIYPASASAGWTDSADPSATINVPTTTGNSDNANTNSDSDNTNSNTAALGEQLLPGQCRANPAYVAANPVLSRVFASMSLITMRGTCVNHQSECDQAVPQDASIGCGVGQFCCASRPSTARSVPNNEQEEEEAENSGAAGIAGGVAAVGQRASLTTFGIKGENVRLRSGPGTSHSIAGKVSTGDTVRATENPPKTHRGPQYTWTEVTHNGETVWIASQFLEAQ